MTPKAYIDESVLKNYQEALSRISTEFNAHMSKYNRLFQKAKETRLAEIWYRKHGGGIAKAKMERLQRELDALIMIEVSERKADPT